MLNSKFKERKIQIESSCLNQFIISQTFNKNNNNLFYNNNKYLCRKYDGLWTDSSAKIFHRYFKHICTTSYNATLNLKPTIQCRKSKTKSKHRFLLTKLFYIIRLLLLLFSVSNQLCVLDVTQISSKEYNNSMCVYIWRHKGTPNRTLY